MHAIFNEPVYEPLQKSHGKPAGLGILVVGGGGPAENGPRGSQFLEMPLGAFVPPAFERPKTQTPCGANGSIALLSLVSVDVFKCCRLRTV